MTGNPMYTTMMIFVTECKPAKRDLELVTSKLLEAQGLTLLHLFEESTWFRLKNGSHASSAAKGEIDYDNSLVSALRCFNEEWDAWELALTITKPPQPFKPIEDFVPDKSRDFYRQDGLQESVDAFESILGSIFDSREFVGVSRSDAKQRLIDSFLMGDVIIKNGKWIGDPVTNLYGSSQYAEMKEIFNSSPETTWFTAATAYSRENDNVVHE